MNEAGQWFVAPSVQRGRADARRVHRPGQGGGLPDHGDPGRDRRRRTARHVGRAARGVRPVERATRASTPARPCCRRCGRRLRACARRCSSTRPTRHGFHAKATGRWARPIAQRPVLGSDPHLQPRWNWAAASRRELGAAHLQPRRQRRHPVRLRHAEHTSRSRSVGRCGCRPIAWTSSPAASTPSVGCCITTGR